MASIDENRAFVVVVVVIGALYLNGVERTQVSDSHITYLGRRNIAHLLFQFCGNV